MALLYHDFVPCLVRKKKVGAPLDGVSPARLRPSFLPDRFVCPIIV
jgi:hypothetical protein